MLPKRDQGQLRDGKVLRIIGHEGQIPRAAGGRDQEIYEVQGPSLAAKLSKPGCRRACNLRINSVTLEALQKLSRRILFTPLDPQLYFEDREGRTPSGSARSEITDGGDSLGLPAEDPDDDVGVQEVVSHVPSSATGEWCWTATFADSA